MKYIIFILIIFFVSNKVFSRSIGETEIISEDGIEVFQDEKYYLLKKNVKITSDNFMLSADNIKIFFNKNLYDISKIEAKDDIDLISKEFGIRSKGKNLNFDLVKERILVTGLKSELFIDNIKMFSDGKIEVDNISGEFILKGKNSSLFNNDILIRANLIDGIFGNNDKGKKIEFLFVSDENISYVKSKNTEMYANKIKFDNNQSFIELEKNVKIIRNGEIITGDYGSLDTKTNSYKIKSNTNNKVRIIISNDDK